MPNLVGIGNSQVPTNAMLGGLAYQSPDHVTIKDADIKNITAIDSIKEGRDASPQQTSANGGRTVFVYDTRKDSDGGAWRKRCQHTSWYNEQLGTGIRGNRKEFPAVAIIVSYSDYVDIYDADQPDCPLWMQFPHNDENSSNRNIMYGTGTVRCVYALNGVMIFGSHANNFWPVMLNFITDEVLGLRHSTGGHKEYGGGIGQRHAATSDSEGWWGSPADDKSKWWFSDRDVVLADSFIYDVNMWVPPDAPIWEPMGIPAPSIVWGTDAGITIWEGVPTRSHTGLKAGHKACYLSGVNGNGEFCVIYNNNNPTYNEFFPGLYIRMDQNYYTFWDASVAVGMSIQWDPQGAKCFWLGKKTNATWYDLALYNDGGNGINIYYGGGKDGYNTNQTRMLAQITSKFNTGIQPMNTQAVLCASSTTDDHYYNKLSTADGVNASGTVTYSGSEMLTNPTPTTNITGWTDNSGSGSSATYSSTGGGSIYLNGSTAYANATQALTTVVGQWYVFSVATAAQTFSSNHEIVLVAGNSAPSGQNLNAQEQMTVRPEKTDHVPSYLSEEFPAVLQYKATATTTYFSVHSGYPVYVRNMSVRECVPDRAFRVDITQHAQRSRGYAVHGSIKASPVEPGAELLCYHNFTTSNYLGGLYTPNLNFSTSQQYISVWVKVDSSDGLKYIYRRGTADGAESMRLGIESDAKIYFDYGDGNEYCQTNRGMSTSRWNHIFAYVKAGEAGEVFVNGRRQEYSHQYASDGNGFPNATTYTSIIGMAYGSAPFPGKIALLKIGGLIPSDEQIRRIYYEELPMFQPNAKCTLQGFGSTAHDTVKAAEYDDSTGIMHVGNSQGRSDFRGLVRINSTTDAINASISASGGVIVES